MNLANTILIVTVIWSAWYFVFDQRHGCTEPGVFQTCESDGDED